MALRGDFSRKSKEFAGLDRTEYVAACRLPKIYFINTWLGCEEVEPVRIGVGYP
jgi:hypothetical protein